MWVWSSGGGTFRSRGSKADGERWGSWGKAVDEPGVEWWPHLAIEPRGVARTLGWFGVFICDEKYEHGGLH